MEGGKEQYTRVEIMSDGNCFYGAVAEHLFGDQQRHEEVRERVEAGRVETRARMWNAFGGDQAAVDNQEGGHLAEGPNRSTDRTRQ